MTVILTREVFEMFLWDNGLSLPFPLHLGPVGESGVRPHLVRPERVFDADTARRRGTFPESVVVTLEDLIRVLRAPETIVFGYVCTQARDEPDTRFVSAGIVRGNDAVVVTEAPDGVHLASVSWPEVTGAVVAALPAVSGLPMVRASVRVEALGPLADAVGRGASVRTVARVATAAGLPEGLFARLAEVKSRAVLGGFLGVCRERGGERVLSPVSADLFAAADGGVLRWSDGVDMTFEAATPAAMARVLAQALTRLPDPTGVAATVSRVA